MRQVSIEEAKRWAPELFETGPLPHGGPQNLQEEIDARNKKPPGKTGPTRREQREAVLTRIADLEVQAIRASANAYKSDDLKIAQAKVAAYKELVRLSKGNKEDVAEAVRLLAQAELDVYNIEQDIRQDAQQARDEAAQKAREAEARRRERERARARAYRARLRAREQTLENALDRAKTVQAQRTARAKLVAFFRAEANDEKLTAEERARYQKKLQAVQKDAVKEELDLRERILRNAVARAALTEKNTKDDIAAQRRLVAFLKKASENQKLTRKEAEKYRAEYLREKKKLNDLLKPKKEEGSDYRDVQRQFLAAAQDIFRRYAPNYGTYMMGGGGPGGPGLSPTQAYELVESNRETARYMRVVAGRGRFVDTGYGAVVEAF